MSQRRNFGGSRIVKRIGFHPQYFLLDTNKSIKQGFLILDGKKWEPAYVKTSHCPFSKFGNFITEERNDEGHHTNKNSKYPLTVSPFKQFDALMSPWALFC
jgi:hypothetical protein